jgi:peptide/nickel transport system permease protein
MGKYILRRLIIALPSLLGISLILFVLLALAPGDPFGELATNTNIPPEVRAALRVKFGIDDPIFVRYLRWLVAMLHGDWGFSFSSRINVDQLILQRVPTTLFVVGSSQILALVIALPVGVYAAMRPYSIFDQIANTVAFVGFSLPTFFTGLLLILIFSVNLGWLPFVYRTDIGRISSKPSCRSQSSGCFRRRPIPATCAPRCLMSSAWIMSPPRAPRASTKARSSSSTWFAMP